MDRKKHRQTPRTGGVLRSSVFTGVVLGGLLAPLLFIVVFFLDEGQWDFHAAGVIGIMALFAASYGWDLRKQVRKSRRTTKWRLG